MIKHIRLVSILAVVGLSVLSLASCSGSNSGSGGIVRLQGAGATFPNPVYQKWFSEYNKITPHARFDYQSIGSGGGIKQITARTVDFGGSDAPMKDEELKAAPGRILHIPTVLGAVGEFVKPTLDSITAAAAGVAAQMPDDMRISITNAPGQNAYPISSFTYLLVYEEQPDQAKGAALVDFLWWATHDGQQMARNLSYAPLPPEVVAKAEAKIKAITFEGKPLRS